MVTFSAAFARQGGLDDEKRRHLTMSDTESELVEPIVRIAFDADRAESTGRIEFLNVLPERSEALPATGDVGSARPGAQPKSTLLVGSVAQHPVDPLVVDSPTMTRTSTPTRRTRPPVRFGAEAGRSDVDSRFGDDRPTSYPQERSLADGVVFIHHYLDGDGM